MSDYRDDRPTCKYGEKCYQKNTNHRSKFQHPSKKLDLPINDGGNIKKRKSEDECFSEDISTKHAKAEEVTPPPRKVSSPSDGLHISPAISPVLAAAGSSETKNEEPNQDGVSTTATVFSSDEEELTADPPTIEESIKQKFLVDMPKDFYKFWEFCKNIKTSDPSSALSCCGIKLVGAYDVVAGKTLIPRTQSRYLCHWRYYYDPPELQTVLSCSKPGGHHIGYFRDSPTEDPVFLASMSQDKPGTITPVAGNIFDAVWLYCEEAVKTADPFKKTALVKLIKQLESGAEKHGFKFSTKAEVVRQRKRNVVCRSFHGAGIVVPVDKKTEVGYREIPETDASLRRMMQKVVDAKTEEARGAVFDDVEELMTNAQWATDEGDFGMGLELGMDLFINGSHLFHKSAQHLMTVAYCLLNRGQFSIILQAHLKNRRKGDKLSAFN